MYINTFNDKSIAALLTNSLKYISFSREMVILKPKFIAN